MALRCINPISGGSIHAFELSPDAWQALAQANRKARHLRMPCCSSQVVLKRSRRGTQHFAHKALGACATAPESEVHLRLKRMAVEAARANGWDAMTEVSGTTPSGEQWMADMLALRGNVKVAVEIQWSSQTEAETRRRQERYARSGVRCLWLLRQGEIPADHNLPAAGIAGSLEEGLIALVPTGWDAQRVPMEAFLDAAFSGRFRFGIPLGATATASICVGHMSCWSCGCDTPIITGINVAVGPHTFRFTIPEIGERPGLVEILRDHLPSNQKFEAIKVRFSRTLERAYLSNGCAHCDAIVGQHYEYLAASNQKTLCVFPMRMSEQWRQALREHEGYRDGWGVYPA